MDPLTTLPLRNAAERAFIESTEEASLLGLCHSAYVPIIPLGAGTSLEGHVAPVRSGMARRYERDRLEAACERALAINAISYSSVSAILKSSPNGPNAFLTSAEPKTAANAFGAHRSISLGAHSAN